MKLSKLRFLFGLSVVLHGFSQEPEFHQVVAVDHPYDTLYQLQKSAASTFSFSGTVFPPFGLQIDECVITLINANDIQPTLQYKTNISAQTQPTNTFTLSNIPEGNYILRADPSSSTLKTTYFSNAATMDNAYIFTLNGNISGVQFYLLGSGIIVTNVQTDYSNSTSSFKAYPNPFVEKLNLYNPVGQTVEILDASGKSMHKTSLTLEMVNTASWKSGVYFVKKEDGSVLKYIKV